MPAHNGRFGAMAAVTGMIAGGVLGEGDATDCAALNPSVSSSENPQFPSFGRVVGSGTATNCIAFSGMTLPAGATADGTSMTKAQIQADGTLGGRFPNNGNPWTTANGKLPGFGAAIDLPSYLSGN